MQEADYGMTAGAMGGTPGTNPDDMLAVLFFIKPLQNDSKSKEEGRPIFEDAEWISIMAPGSRNKVMRPIRHKDKERFPRHYAAFKNRTEQDFIEGTPLAEWTGVTRSQVEELKFWNISTVEQLANTADSATGAFRGFVTLKQNAIKYLEASKGNAMAEKFAALEAKYEALLAKVDGGEPVEAQKPKRRRRTRAEMDAATPATE
jgi:hypothetical protein